jgi:hypothetical protein
MLFKSNAAVTHARAKLFCRRSIAAAGGVAMRCGRSATAVRSAGVPLRLRAEDRHSLSAVYSKLFHFPPVVDAHQNTPSHLALGTSAPSIWKPINIPRGLVCGWADASWLHGWSVATRRCRRRVMGLSSQNG